MVVLFAIHVCGKFQYTKHFGKYSQFNHEWNFQTLLKLKFKLQVNEHEAVFILYF